MRISYHANDWCHVCGERAERLADVNYPVNAEHEASDTHYVRICLKCAEALVRVMVTKGD